MLIIIFNIIVGLIVSFLITMDASLATLYLGESTLSDIPMFSVVFGSMIFGMFIASLTTIKNLIESKLTIFGQKNDLKKSYKTAESLESKVNKLEEENLLLKEQIKELVHPKKVAE